MRSVPTCRVAVEQWIESRVVRAAIDQAALEEDAWYTSAGLDGHAPVIATDSYRSASEQHRHMPRMALRRDMLVSDDHNETARLARSVIERSHRCMNTQIIAGGVDHVVERMVWLGSINIDDTGARTTTVDQSTALQSIGLRAYVRATIARRRVNGTRLIGPTSATMEHGVPPTWHPCSRLHSRSLGTALHAHVK